MNRHFVDGSPGWQPPGLHIVVPRHPLHGRMAAPPGRIVCVNKPSLATFTARASGDLDGDGIYSRFELSGETRPGEAPVVYYVEMDREVE